MVWLPPTLSFSLSPESLPSSHGGLPITRSQQAWSCLRAFAPAVPSAWNTLLPDLCPLTFLCLQVPRTMPSTQMTFNKHF